MGASAKASAKKVEWAEKERDEAMQEAKVARLIAVAVGDSKARVEDDLSRALDALAVVEEDGRRLEVELAHRAVERTSLLLELEASKDEVPSLHSHEGKDKEDVEKDYKKALSLFFLMAMGAASSNTTSAVTSQGFWMAFLILPTLFL